MFRSIEVNLDDKYCVHLGVFPHLGLIIVNELEDFAENWLEVKVTEQSKCNLIFDVNTLSGHSTEGALQAAARYLIKMFYDSLHKDKRPSLETVGSLLKFTLNIKLRPEILNNRAHVTSLGNALGSLVSS